MERWLTSAGIENENHLGVFALYPHTMPIAILSPVRLQDRHEEIDWLLRVGHRAAYPIGGRPAHDANRLPHQCEP
ncbi:MAG: hypothetical protein C3F08_00775 [Candidatus Methylomirabilota bacterium]|nr:MAG: hypothetical protein C3F08_00775 [candidate division NC10 bacterium]